MRWMGICERAFEMMCQYAVKREIAPGKPLGTRQMVQDFIAESRADIDAAKLLIHHAAWKIDKQGYADQMIKDVEEQEKKLDELINGNRSTY